MLTPSWIIAILLALVMLFGVMAFFLMKAEVLLIILLIIAGVGFGAYWILQRQRRQPFAAKPVSVGRPSVVRNDYAVHYAILKEIQEVAELIVVRENFHEVVHYNDSAKTTLPFFDHEISIPGTNKNLLVEYQAIITCGCKNLDAIKIERSTLAGGNSIRMIVPYSQILDRYVEPDSVKVHNKSEQIFASAIDLEQQNQILAVHLDELVQKETENGLLEKSNDCIRRRLLNIAYKNGVTAEIIFTKKELPPHSENPSATYIDVSDLPRLRQ